MKATVVVDNIAGCGLKGEWGLCIFIEHESRKILLDAGHSDLFENNMKKLRIPVEDIDIAVLSHAHSDHSGGFPRFFELNHKAKLYLQECCSENCYLRLGFLNFYAGIPKGMLDDYADRLVRIKGKEEICSGVYLLPHKKPAEALGKYQHMYVKIGGKLTADDFSHEQSMVIRTGKGLVIFNSCSHTGADAIISEVTEAFPAEHIHAYIGGLHLAGRDKSYMRQIASGIKGSDVDMIYTGHCTKEKGFAVLKEELGDRISQFEVGMVMEF